MKMLVSLWFVLLAWLSSGAIAQESSLDAAISELPGCALECLVQGIAQSPCTITNQTCTCTDAQLQSSVQACVLKSCTVIEGLVTKNITTTTCGQPIRDRSGQYSTISTTFAVISSTFVLLRVAQKLFLTGAELGLDDLFIIITILSGVPSTVINAQGMAPNGLGRDIWTLHPAQITNFVRFFYVMTILYFAQITLLKLSLLFFYLRIFPARPVKRTIWATVAFNATFGSIFVIVAIFQCRPISFYWTNWDGQHHGKCVSINAVAWSNAAISIALDLWMLAIPLSQLIHLELAWKKKVGVALMFCVGTFVTIVSILRLQYLVHFADTINPTWDYFNVSNWSTIEINVGIICTCMPSIRIILVRMLPKVFGSIYDRQGSNYDKQASNNRSRGRSFGMGGQRSQESTSTRKDNIIEYTTTVEIQHEGRHGVNDEVSLVHMDSLNPKEYLRTRSNDSDISL